MIQRISYSYRKAILMKPSTPAQWMSPSYIIYLLLLVNGYLLWEYGQIVNCIEVGLPNGHGLLWGYMTQ